MKPCAFFDIEVRSSSTSGPGGIPALPVMSRLVWVLHGIIRIHPARFALAFPRMRKADLDKGILRHPGNVVRVFAGSRDDLDIVVAALTANERIHGYVQYGYPKLVPENFNGEWKQYRRFRIPGTTSRTEVCRSNRLAAGENLPFFRTSSKTTGQSFSLHVDCVDIVDDGKGLIGGDCQPDSYGLSVATRPFALPVLP